MPNEFPAREVTQLVALFQKAHSKIISLTRMDDQIAAMVVQHERLQEEIRVVQNEINQEFERALKFNQAPTKLPPTVGFAPTVSSPISQAAPPGAISHAPSNGAVNGDRPKGDRDAIDLIPLAHD